ncbi:HEAT repeat domain-containing protein (plasmid) [Paenibacillus polymyxa]|uniref:HEAT repeat domain-containing protein n=1 Tax=Paenibacillus polymyxa TaxID=1406 RepID=UPI003B5BE5FD
MDKSFSVGIPNNIIKLKHDANNKSSWSIRLGAVKELSMWSCQQSIDILKDRMKNDKVYKVQEAAFRGLQAFDVPVKLPRKKKGNLIEGIDKYLTPIKNDLPVGHSYEEFKEAFSRKRPVEFNTYEGDKESRFDSWLENKWKSLPKKK